MTEHIDRLKQHINLQLKYILMFATLFTLLSIIAHEGSHLYFSYFDKTKYYDIVNPITVEKRTNYACGYVDAYIHRKVLAPIQGTSVKQLTLIRRDNGLNQRVQSYVTAIQADVGEATVITHWRLPCDIDPGTYFFEGTVAYKIGDIQKTTHFYTETFDVVASHAAELQIK